MEKLAVSVIFIFLIQFSQVCLADSGKKKILYIDSYHIEYAWSANIYAGIKSILDNRNDIELKVLRMDTKRNKSEEFKKNAAIKARDLIETWRPDVVIASDDNASKYLIVPYYKNSDIPFVFCGLNEDASIYGFPDKNVTGMVEVSLYQETIDAIRPYARGDRIGFLSSDTVSERKDVTVVTKRLTGNFTARFAHTFTELQEKFLELQTQVDMIILRECLSVKDFNHRQMMTFIRENAKVPIGATLQYLKHYALLTFAKSGEEQGEYAARTALSILAGKSPQDIPVVTNKRAKIYLNMPLAKKMNIRFPMELLENSHLISADQKKLFYVNSYHQGYKWSDDIEKGLLKALNIKINTDGSLDDSQSEVKIKIFRMDSKINSQEKAIRKTALKAKKMIDKWQPDILLASDDNASKYLIAPFYKNTNLPVVVCGINWDASTYGFPTRNITGMVEVEPVQESLRLLAGLAKGDRVGLLAADNLSNRKTIQSYQKLGLNFSITTLVDNFADWQKEYIRMQDTVDMILLLTPLSAKGWDDAVAEKFIMDNTKIPTAITSDHNIRLALLGMVKIAAEQGWWAGKTALSILDGVSPAEIPLAQNKETRLYLNMGLARRLHIKFPMEILEKASFVQDRDGAESN